MNSVLRFDDVKISSGSKKETANPSEVSRQGMLYAFVVCLLFEKGFLCVALAVWELTL